MSNTEPDRIDPPRTRAGTPEFAIPNRDQKRTIDTIARGWWAYTLTAREGFILLRGREYGPTYWIDPNGLSTVGRPNDA